MKPQVSRRTLLVSAAATASTGFGAGAWVLTGRTEAYLADLLMFCLKGEAVSAESVTAFVRDYLAVATPDTRRNARILAWAARIVGVGGVDALLSARPSYDWFKRAFVTRFMLASDFFDRSSPERQVTYFGITRTCSNPFARF